MRRDRPETWGEPRSNDVGLAGALARMAGFRNLIVHGYEVVDLAIVRDVVENRLDDLLAFATTIDAWVDGAVQP